MFGCRGLGQMLEHEALDASHVAERSDLGVVIPSDLSVRVGRGCSLPTPSAARASVNRGSAFERVTYAWSSSTLLANSSARST